MPARGVFFFFICTLTLCSVVVSGVTLEEFLSRNAEVRDFFDYIKRNSYFNASLTYQPGTIFAPTNDAMTVFKSSRQVKDRTLLYHYCNSPYMYKDLEGKDSVPSFTPGNTPLFLTKKGSSMFVNDASVKRIDMVFETPHKQVVHIIDQVLEPTLKSADRGDDNPTAKDLMDHSNYYDVMGDYKISKFAEQVSRKGKAYLYSNFTKATYFIPVDRAFTTLNSNKLEPRVIEGHVIPDAAIFLRTSDIGQPVEAYRPSEFQANTPILITFKKDIGVSGHNYKDMWFVNSDNRQTDPRFHKGVVQAEIVRGNIVVKNGVVHLISKPLVLIDTNVYETFEWYSNKQVWSMREFFKFVRENVKGHEIENILKNSSPNEAVTLFVPSDKAMKESEVLRSLTFAQNTSAIHDIIRTHIIHGQISSLEISDAIKKSKNNVIVDPMDSHTLHRTPFQVPTLVKGGRKLLFSMLTDEDGKKTYHVEGHGANATILQPDIGATNGFIHIIDKVLGIPDLNVTAKFASNPMLQLTNNLWKKEKLDSILNGTRESFTIFAPSEKAWMDLRKKGSAGQSAYDGLFYGNPGEVVSKMFKRLVIPDHAYTIEKLTELSKSANATAAARTRLSQDGKNVTDPWGYPLTTLGGHGGSLKVNSSMHRTNYGPNVGSHDEAHYFVYWKNMKAHVARPNVKCTNGIIHIIDEILMDDEEITVASAPQPHTSSLIGILSISIFTMFAKYIM